MPDIDPLVFSIRRPPLSGYRMFAARGLIVESYRSAAGHMLSCGSLHRISVNRTPHRRYAYRSDTGAYRAVPRRSFTLGFQPAMRPLEVEGDGADYVTIYQDPDLYDQLCGHRIALDEDHGVLSKPMDPTTLQVVKSMVVAAAGPDPADPLLMEHLSIGLACCVARLLGGSPADLGAVSPRRFERVIGYIEASLARPGLSLDELAGVAGFSMHHFGRAFRQAMGVTPHRYVLERRILHAQRRLAAGRESLAEIALAVGFSSQAHLTTTFRQITGMTPFQYRRTIHA